MSGKAIIVLVAGVIVISCTVMFNIEAASTRIVKNFSDYYMRQNTQNIAQSGVNLAMAQIAKNRNWRVGYSNLNLLDGVVDVEVTDTKFDSIPAIGIRSIAVTDYGNNQKRRDTSTAWVFWPQKQSPVKLRSLLTLNSNANVAGNATFDGRDHDLNGALVAAQGVPAVWTTGASFNIVSGAADIGGTDLLLDYAPSNPGNPAVIKLSMVDPGGYPGTPDSVFGGAVNGIPEGTLKAIARSGYAGSQYVTDPSKLKFPLTGVTYVEMPTTSPQNEWSSADLEGEGIVVVHNAAKNAIMKNADGEFKGLIIADDVVHLHGNILGGVIALRSALSGNVVGNGNAKLLYSRQALVEAMKFLETNGKPSVIAWWE